MPARYDDAAGPPDERYLQAGFEPAKPGEPARPGFYEVVGRAKSNRHITMLDNALGKALVRRSISPEDYAALRKYALHWVAGGLQGHLGTVDLNRIFSFDPGSMTGLTKTEAQADHRALYWAARADMGMKSWTAFVADQVALYDNSVSTIGVMLGYRSPSRGRDRAVEFLKDAGYRLAKFWNDQAKRN